MHNYHVFCPKVCFFPLEIKLLHFQINAISICNCLPDLKTTFQLFRADSFIHKRLKSKSLLLWKVQQLFGGSSEALHKSYYSIPLQQAPERQDNRASCFITCKEGLSGKPTHLQYGNKAVETIVSKPCHNSAYICFRLF